MESADPTSERYGIEQEDRWVQAVRRKRRGDADFIQRFEEALPIIRGDPYGRSEIRIIPLRHPLKGRFRYKHGRCRIIYSINEERRTVRLLRVEPRDEGTYDF
jgi:mRNA-degrading endonuclease RelE of RelBE toxin-antitoxin system